MPSCAELAKDIATLRAELASMQESLSMFNGLYESVKVQNETILKENKFLKEENAKLSQRLTSLEQYSRLNNVEIKGVPVTEGENCLAVIQAIGKKIGCPVVPSDIDIAHRVPAKKDKNIIARFCSRSKRTEFISKARKAKLATSAIGLSRSSDSPFFVNDHLTPENKRLFAQALELKKAKGWRFLWTENCVIKARKTENSRVYRISNANDLAIFT